MAFSGDAADAFSPSMRQNLALAPLYQLARRAMAEERIDAQATPAMPAECPWHLDMLLADPPDLKTRVAAAMAAPTA